MEDLEKLTKAELIKRVAKLQPKPKGNSYLVPLPKPKSEMHSLDELDWRLEEEKARVKAVKDSTNAKVVKERTIREKNIIKYEKRFIQAYMAAQECNFEWAVTGSRIAEEDIKKFTKRFNKLIAKHPATEKPKKGFN